MAEGEGRFVEYAGGYSDMLAQRGNGVAAKPTEKPERSKTKRTPQAAAAPSKRRLTFKEKHLLETLPGRIARLEADTAAAQAKLADAGLYARDAQGFATLADRLAAAQSELGTCEEQWLELEILRQEIGG